MFSRSQHGRTKALLLSFFEKASSQKQLVEALIDANGRMTENNLHAWQRKIEGEEKGAEEETEAEYFSQKNRRIGWVLRTRDSLGQNRKEGWENSTKFKKAEALFNTLRMAINLGEYKISDDGHEYERPVWQTGWRGAGAGICLLWTEQIDDVKTAKPSDTIKWQYLDDKALQRFEEQSNFPFFVGREEQLEEARQALAKPGSCLLITGQPGIGKTKLAEVVSSKRAYKHVYWVSAGFPHALTQDQIIQAITTQHIVEAHRCQKEIKEEDELIVIDGLTKHGSLSRILARFPLGRLVVTSIRSKWDFGVRKTHTILLELFTLKETELLVESFGGAYKLGGKQLDIQRLHGLWHGLPLGIHLTLTNLDILGSLSSAINKLNSEVVLVQLEHDGEQLIAQVLRHIGETSNKRELDLLYTTATLASESFSQAIVSKVSGYSEEEAEKILLEWCRRCIINKLKSKIKIATTRDESSFCLSVKTVRQYAVHSTIARCLAKRDFFLEGVYSHQDRQHKTKSWWLEQLEELAKLDFFSLDFDLPIEEFRRTQTPKTRPYSSVEDTFAEHALNDDVQSLRKAIKDNDLLHDGQFVRLLWSLTGIVAKQSKTITYTKVFGGIASPLRQCIIEHAVSVHTSDKEDRNSDLREQREEMLLEAIAGTPESVSNLSSITILVGFEKAQPYLKRKKKVEQCLKTVKPYRPRIPPPIDTTVRDYLLKKKVDEHN